MVLFIPRRLYLPQPCYALLWRPSCSHYATAVANMPPVGNKPKKFSESPAFTKYRSGGDSRGYRIPGKDYDAHMNNDWEAKRAAIIFGSIFLFMIYFATREENDLDEELDKPLYKRLPQMEKEVLEKLVYIDGLKGKDVTEHERRIKELDSQLSVVSGKHNSTGRP